MSGLEKLKKMLEEDFMFFESRAKNFKDERSEAFNNGMLSYHYWLMNLINLLIDSEENGKHDMKTDDRLLVCSRNKEMLELIPIDELQLSVRSYNTLSLNGITDLYMLTSMTRRQLSSLRNLGKKSLTEIIEKLADYGLSLKEDEENDG